ncbi:MAG: DinB family protein [Armatimonadetes bacterium]|nr:DinB family protein [Armatimonadota bacterium]
MSNTPQQLLARATRKAADDLVAALQRLPEDKRNWSPMGNARTALDQIAECALLNGRAADLIQTHTWSSDNNMDAFLRAKAELAQDADAAQSLLEQNTAKVIAAIEAVPDADLGVEVQTPFRPMTLAQIIAYPYWNMTYHEGQINYIASMLGCL